MKAIIEKIEGLNVGFGYMFLVFFFAITFRTFFENFVTLNHSGTLNSFINTFFHHPLWYIAVFLGLILIMSFLSKEKTLKVFKLVSFGSFVIVLPVILDYLFYGRQSHYDYIIGDWTHVFREYYTLLINNQSFGLGIKVEILIVLSAIFYYFYFYLKKSFLRSFMAIFMSYTFIFSMLILPNIIYFISSLFISLPGATAQSIKNFLFSVYFNSEIIFSRTYLLSSISGDIRLETARNFVSTLMAQFSFYVLICISFCLFILKFGKRKTFYFFNNFRWLRITHYTVLMFFGVMLPQKNSNLLPTFSDIYSWSSIVSVSLSIIFAWLFAVWENDEVDVLIDETSNSDRPLVRGVFTLVEWKNMKWTFLILSIISAVLSGYSTLVLTIVFIVVYHIYSVYPLRLKRYPVISSVLIAINACVAFLIGYFLVVGVNPFDYMPTTVLFGIFIFYICVENIKNLKDIDGDKKDDILTIPVIFGKRKGQIITWTVVFIGSFVIPILILPTKSLSLVAPVLGAVSYFLIVKENYKEKPLMLFYLISFILLLCL